MSCGLPPGYGLVLWSLAIIHLVRRRLVTPVTPLLALPLLGLFVDRAYWANLITPFIVLWVGELVGDVWAERRTRTPDHPRRGDGGVGAGLSPAGRAPARSGR